jgi:hypothetical protein
MHTQCQPPETNGRIDFRDDLAPRTTGGKRSASRRLLPSLPPSPLFLLAFSPLLKLCNTIEDNAPGDRGGPLWRLQEFPSDFSISPLSRFSPSFSLLLYPLSPVPPALGLSIATAFPPCYNISEAPLPVRNPKMATAHASAAAGDLVDEKDLGAIEQVSHRKSCDTLFDVVTYRRWTAHSTKTVPCP